MIVINRLALEGEGRDNSSNTVVKERERLARITLSRSISQPINQSMLLGSVALFLLLAAILIAASPLLAMAQQTLPPPPSSSSSSMTTGQTTTLSPQSSSASAASPSTTTAAAAPTPPLTPEEQEQQNRLQNVIAATNQNLNETEKQVNGIVFTPRWSEPVWVKPGALSILLAYCLPGEFADSGQEILGGFELEVLESYAVAFPQGGGFMAWMAVVGNEDEEENVRLPAAVGVICASDLNDAQARVLSPEEQQQINNINQQFTQVTNIDQVINIINNVTVNATTGPVTPPPPANDTGVVPDTTPPVFIGTKPESRTQVWDDPYAANGIRVIYGFYAEDNVDGKALYQSNDVVIQQDDVGGDISIECNPDSGSLFPLGTTTVQCTAVDQAGNVGTYSWTETHLLRPEGVLPPPETGQEGQPPGALLPGLEPGEEGGGEEEGPTEEAPVQEEEAPVEEQPPAAEEPAAEEEAATPPANIGEEGGG